MKKIKSRMYITIKYLATTHTKPARYSVSFYELKRVYSSDLLPGDVPCDMQEQWFVEHFLEDIGNNLVLDCVVQYENKKLFICAGR